jgi:hypothetical protein
MYQVWRSQYTLNIRAICFKNAVSYLDISIHDEADMYMPTDVGRWEILHNPVKSAGTIAVGQAHAELLDRLAEWCVVMYVYMCVCVCVCVCTEKKH